MLHIKKIILKNTNSNNLKEFLRFFIVGILTAIIDFSILFLLTDFLKINYLISNAIAFCLGLMFNYILNVLWVFKIRTIKSKSLEFIFFALIAIASLLINEAIIWIFTAKLSFHYMISKIFSTGAVFLFSFFARKRFLFS
jgi:putative flippase GtrA